MKVKRIELLIIGSHKNVKIKDRTCILHMILNGRNVV